MFFIGNRRESSFSIRLELAKYRDLSIISQNLEGFMRHFLTALFVSAGLSFSFVPTPSFAKTPPEVLEPYKKYTSALESKNKSKAAQYAYEAWEAAEELIGDAKITGDLAQNLALLKPRNLNDKSADKIVKRAFERSIALAKFYESDSDGIELQRRVDYLNWVAAEKISVSNAHSLSALEDRIKELGFAGSTFHAECKALTAQNFYAKKNWDKTIENGEAGLEMFDTADDGVVSYLRYLTPIYLALAYEEKKDDIKAVQTYQKLITDLDAHDAHDNVVSGKAYAEWLRLRDEVLKEYPDDPRVESIRSFRVPDGRSKELLPLVRRPALFPKSFSAGSKSGKVIILYDIDAEGYVINPKIKASSNKSLHKPSLEAIKAWRYTPNIPLENRQGLETGIRFDLSSRGGRLLPLGEMVSRE